MRQTKERILKSLLIAIYGLASTGVVLFSQTTQASATTSKHSAAVQLAKFEIPLIKALRTFEGEGRKLSDTSTAAQNAKVATPLGDAIQRFQEKILDQTWPSTDKNDARALYSSCSPLIADLLTVNTVNNFSASSWTSKTSTDLENWAADLNLFNHDLGLPSA